MKESPTAYMPEKYINKENLITQTTLAMNMNPEYLAYFNGKYRTAIDVLRLMSSLSGGDVSLKDIDTVKFKSFPKNLQRTFLVWLNNCSLFERIKIRKDGNDSILIFYQFFSALIAINSFHLYIV